jgi:hypothetical protein
MFPEHLAGYDKAMRVVTTLLSCLVVAGCAAGGPGSGPSVSPTTSAPTSAGVGPVAACVVGDWQTSATKLSTTGLLSSGSASGGGGVTLKVGAGGQTEVDFTPMQPVAFSGTASGAAVKGQFFYAGKASGQIRTGDATSMSGTWEPVGKANWADVLVTLELTEPITAKPFDKLPLANALNDATNTQTGGVVDTDPLLGKAKYTCSGSVLTLAPEDNSGVTWELTKKS